jgi:hypothetical protein
MYFQTSHAKILNISFWIYGDVYFALYGAFSNTTLAISGLKSAISLTISRKFPLFLDWTVSSLPLKAQAWSMSHLTAATDYLSLYPEGNDSDVVFIGMVHSGPPFVHTMHKESSNEGDAALGGGEELQTP